MRHGGRQIQIDLSPWSQVHILFFTNTVASTSIVFSTVSTFGSMVVLTKIHRRFEPLPSLLIQIIKSFSSETVDSDDSDVDWLVRFFVLSPAFVLSQHPSLLTKGDFRVFVAVRMCGKNLYLILHRVCPQLKIGGQKVELRAVVCTWRASVNCTRLLGRLS